MIFPLVFVMFADDLGRMYVSNCHSGFFGKSTRGDNDRLKSLYIDVKPATYTGPSYIYLRL